MSAANAGVPDDSRAVWPDAPTAIAESVFVACCAFVSSSPQLCASLLRLLDGAKIPFENLLARPENHAGARLDVFERFRQITKPMRGTHDIRVYHQSHHSRGFRCIGIKLLELIDGTLFVLSRRVVLNQHHGRSEEHTSELQSPMY